MCAKSPRCIFCKAQKLASTLFARFGNDTLRSYAIRQQQHSQKSSLEDPVQAQVLATVSSQHLPTAHLALNVRGQLVGRRVLQLLLRLVRQAVRLVLQVHQLALRLVLHTRTAYGKTLYAQILHLVRQAVGLVLWVHQLKLKVVLRARVHEETTGYRQPAHMLLLQFCNAAYSQPKALLHALNFSFLQQSLSQPTTAVRQHAAKLL